MVGKYSNESSTNAYTQPESVESGEELEYPKAMASDTSWRTHGHTLEATEFAPTEASALSDLQRISSWLREGSTHTEAEVGQAGLRYALDLRKLSGKATEARSKFAPLLTNLLLSERAQSIPLDVRTPRDSKAAAHLARAGVLFALARHHDQRLLSDDGPLMDEGIGDWLEPWQRDWKPVTPRRTLFDLVPGVYDEEPDTMGDKIVAFLNPRPSRIDVEARKNAIYPWLTHFLGRLGETGRDIRREILRDVSSVTNELLDNVRDHADADQAFLILSATGGGSKRVLQLTVVDNGCGIPASILQNRYENSEDPNTYIANSISGTQPRRSRGRGDGLAEVGRVTRKYDGNLVLATGPTRDDLTVLIDHNFTNDGSSIVPKSIALGIGGTVVVVRLPIGEHLTPSR